MYNLISYNVLSIINSGCLWGLKWLPALQNLDSVTAILFMGWLALSWRPHSSHQIPLPWAHKASFLPAQHFGNLLKNSTDNGILFQAVVCVCGCVCVCIVFIYILTWFKSTSLSAIIITCFVKGSSQFFLHLRRAAAGFAHRHPASTPPALPGIQTASAYTQSHYLPWCNGAFLY